MTKEKKLVVVVTGASRGIGRGIARVFGRRGATVYVVGRSQVKGAQRSPGGAELSGTIHEVAAEVTATGGNGVAVACDMAHDDQIRALFDRVARESGHIDILVNDAAFLHEGMGKRPFWEAPPELANIIDVGLRCHHVATYYAAPLLIAAGRGLIVNISFFGDAKIHDPAYYASKAGLDKLAAVYANEFRPFNVAAISLWPGYVATERMTKLGDAGVKELKDTLEFESTEFSGLVIDALYNDSRLPSLSGKTLIGAEVADRYGLSDIDGGKPKSLRATYGGPHASFDLA
jgi:NAD(P)-dependent dehydrogenase (short-subunit alcohol dehydrogenase family)